MPARLLHRLVRRQRCWVLLVRVEKLLRDLERAELAVPSEDSVVLGMIEAPRYDRSCVSGMEGDASTSKRELDMRWDGRGLDVGRYGQGGARQGTGSRARRRCACSVLLLTGFLATTSLNPCT